MGTTTTETTNAETNARAWLESIREYVAAVECDYKRRSELREELIEAYDDEKHQNDPNNETQFLAWVKDASDNPSHVFQESAEELVELNAAAGEYDDADAARDALRESVLSVQVRSGWADSAEDFVAEEFSILLTTGGPACRIIGELDDYKTPSRARLQYQDWGTPWTELILDRHENESVVAFCREFFFGE